MKHPIQKILIRLVLALLLALTLSVATVSAATFDVDDNGDASDDNAGNGVCATGGAVCTLRAAMEEANALGGAHTITFSIGSGQVTITPVTSLPVMTGGVTIDGTTQEGYTTTPIVKIDGTTAGGIGLNLNSGTNPVNVDGLVLTNWGNGGVYFNGGTAGGYVKNSYIGIDFDGSTAEGNVHGVAVSANDIIVGGDTTNGNVISGNSGYGVALQNTSSGFEVSGNYIGTNAAGTSAVANGWGVATGQTAAGRVGGTVATERNIISGNTNSGYAGGSTGIIQVFGNYIGLNAAGDGAVGNFQGVVAYSANDVIGGTGAGERNIISGNSDGVHIGGGPDETDITVKGNYIGLNPAGTAAIANTDDGLYFDSGAYSNTVEDNVISGNTGDGIEVGDTSPDNIIKGNYIGTNAAGTAAVANGGYGILIDDGLDTIIGGEIAGDGNLISGNTSYGIHVRYSTSNGTIIKGNKIGVNITETAAIANGSAGIHIYDTDNTVIGSETAADPNVIGGSDVGIRIDGSNATVMYGNYLGTNEAKTIDLGGSQGGMSFVNTVTSGTIGGSTTGQENYITNYDRGVNFQSTTISGVKLSRNLIYDNDTIDIDLAEDGVTANDVLDADTGANGQIGRASCRERV